MVRSRPVGLVIGMLLWAAGSRASSFPSARLIYVRGQGAESCPQEMELRLSVAHRLGYDPFHTGSRRTIMAVLEGTDERLSARLELVDEQGVSQGVRRLEAAPGRCADLVRALALSMSIAIDPERVEVEPDATSPPRTTSVFEPPGAESDRAIGDSTGSAHGPLTFRFGLGAQLALRAAPAPAAGLLGIGSVRYGGLSLALEFRSDASASRSVASGARIQSRLVTGNAVPCVHGEPAFVCGVASLGVVEATSDAARPERDSALHATAGIRLGTEWPLVPSLFVRTHADLLGTLTPVRIVLDDRNVWEMPSFSGSLGFALLGSIP